MHKTTCITAILYRLMYRNVCIRWEQSWNCKDKDDAHFKVYSRLETNHGRPSERKVPKGQQPLEIHLFMRVDPSNEQLKTSLSI